MLCPLSALQHYKVEGQIEFSSILFTPRRAPFDLFDGGSDKKKQTNLRLYVRRVFVTDQSSDFCPEWLSCIKGLVDSEDLPLNISRETLQVSRMLGIIKRKVVRKAINMFSELQDDKDKYKTFYEAFSTMTRRTISSLATISHNDLLNHSLSTCCAFVLLN